MTGFTDINQINPVTGACPYSNFPYLGFINEATNGRISNYNSLQTTLTQRLSHGLNFTAGYTYGHGLDDGSENRFGPLPQDSTNTRAEYASSDFDVRHRFTFTTGYEIPGKKGFGQLLEGWKINSIVSVQSAQPWGIADTGNNFSATSESQDRWDFCGGTTPNRGTYGNPSDFTSGANSIPSCAFPNAPAKGVTLANIGAATCTSQSAIDHSVYTFANSAAMGARCTAVAPDPSTLAQGGCFVEGNSVMVPPKAGTFGTMGRNIFRDKTQVRGKIAEALKQGSGNATFFDGVHIFTPHGDVPDDSALRLVVLPPENWYSREESRLAFEAALECMRNNGPKPRYRWNRLLFLAADHSTLSRLNDAARVALAWGSIVDDIKEGRLNIDLLQKKQAEKEQQTAEEVLLRAARECYRWLVCPVQETPTDSKPTVEAFPINTTGGSVGREIERVCVENELVITTWSPIHLRTKLRELYWKEEKPTAGAMAFWEDTLRYLYLPRLKDRDVLAQAIRSGAASRDFFGTAYGQHDGSFDGFQLGSGNVQVDDTLLLIEPDAARVYEEKTRPIPPPVPPGPGLGPTPPEPKPPIPPPPGTQPKAFHGTAEVPPATAKMRMVQIAEEIVSVLASDPNASVKVVVEISAECPNGAKDAVKRAVSENAKSLGLKSADWETWTPSPGFGFVRLIAWEFLNSKCNITPQPAHCIDLRSLIEKSVRLLLNATEPTFC